MSTRPNLRRLGWIAALVAVAAISCVAVVIAGRPADARADRAPARLPRITARSTVAAIAAHFGRPSQSSFRAGSQVDVWVSRNHDWTIVRYIHPRPRPGS